VTALTNYVFQSPPQWSLLSYTVELLLRPGGKVFFPSTNSPHTREQIQFPPLVNCCVNTVNGGWVGTCDWDPFLGALQRARAEKGKVTDAC